VRVIALATEATGIQSNARIEARAQAKIRTSRLDLLDTKLIECVIIHMDVYEMLNGWSNGSSTGPYTDLRNPTPRQSWCGSSSSTRDRSKQDGRLIKWRGEQDEHRCLPAPPPLVAIYPFSTPATLRDVPRMREADTSS
jgi:hypothetical protein